jgi:hypothetical protein
MKLENQGEAATLERISMLDRAVAINARCEPAYLYRGLLHRRLGHDDDALLDLRKAVELNPRSDAVKELRLTEQRIAAGGKGGPPSMGKPTAKDDATPSGLSGLFSRIMKKD